MSATSKLASLASYARTQWGEPAAAKVPGNGGQLQRAAQVGTVISVVVLSVVALQALSNPDVAVDAGNTTQQDEFAEVGVSIVDAAPFALFALVAGVAIAAVRGVG